MRGLAAVDERAEELPHPRHPQARQHGAVESITVRVKRSMLTDLHETVGRLLTRSTGLKKK